MEHQGYTQDQINAIGNNHDAYGCEYDTNSQRWDCTDDDGKSLHPDWDDLAVACEMANVAVKALEEIGWHQ